MRDILLKDGMKSNIDNFTQTISVGLLYESVCLWFALAWMKQEISDKIHHIYKMLSQHVYHVA